MSEDGEWEDDEDLLDPGVIGTPTGAGSDDGGGEQDQLLHVTLKHAFTGQVVYTRECDQSDRSLSVGHFIGIAKQHLSVEESRISLVIGKGTLQATMVAKKVFLLKVVFLSTVHVTLLYAFLRIVN